ncbi:MAG: tail fiber domain-containing protein [Bacteroidales bacterium]|nr:tail fiber domain-containing protein [Bacteroidales bacterium]
MKKSLTALFLALSAGTFTLFSQINVTSSGRAYIGGATEQMIAADSTSTVPLRVFGNPHPQYGYNRDAIIEFGNDPSAVWVGEYAYNSIRTRLYGKGGVYITSTNGNNGMQNLITYDINDPNKVLCLATDKAKANAFYYTSLWQPSDAKFKKDITTLSSSMTKLGRLQGVTYRLDTSESPIFNPGYANAQADSTASVTNRMAASASVSGPASQDTTKHIGFIAQELQEVFPELVTTDNEGNLYVDYVSLIPVIVEALKEQQTVIDAQAEKMEELEAIVRELQNPAQGRIKQTAAGIHDENTPLQEARLYQNTPNPFGQSTQIHYFLPAGTQAANIYIFNMQGTLLKNYPLDSAGEGTLEIQAADLQPGMYIYSLMIDNREIDTKRMVVTQ